MQNYLNQRQYNKLQETDAIKKLISSVEAQKRLQEAAKNAGKTANVNQLLQQITEEHNQ